MTFKHEEISFRFDLNPGDIVDLTLENPKFYRDFVKDLSDDECESFSLSEDGIEKDFGKSALVIRDLFDLDPNSKRILGAIYKKIDKTALSPERQEMFNEINAKISALMMDISADFEGAISFNDALTLPQVLGMIDFKFDYDDSTFLRSLLSYIKAWREATDLKIVFVLNLFALLNASEIASFSSELAYLGLPVINISYISSKASNENIKKVIVDQDLCEIY